MHDLETKLDELFVKKAPFQIPGQSREALVKAMPWVTLLAGVLMLITASTLWSLVSATNWGLGFVNGLGVMYGMGTVAPALTPMVWLGIIMLIVQAVLFFMAYRGLTMRKKSAWNLLFYVSLLNVVEAVVQFIGYTNFGTLLASLIASVIGLYVFFQIRGYYTGEAAPASGGKTPEPPKK